MMETKRRFWWNHSTVLIVVCVSVQVLRSFIQSFIHSLAAFVLFCDPIACCTTSSACVRACVRGIHLYTLYQMGRLYRICTVTGNPFLVTSEVSQKDG